MSKPILLTSVEMLNAHVATLPPTPDVDVWWECPVCGAKNYGILLGSTTPCSACRGYYHPPAWMSAKSRVEIQIEALEEEIAALVDRAEPLRDELDMLEQEIEEKQMQIRVLKRKGRR